MSAVLIVEDEQHLAEGLRFNLELEGYDVEIASDGEAALALLEAQPTRFDVVALDVMLPGINGFEVATALRARGQFAHRMLGRLGLQLARRRDIDRVPARLALRVKGTGLGLFIVRSVIEKHGGKVFAESAGEGLGSTFTLQLPRVASAAESTVINEVSEAVG